jgi:hypothetical protein
METKKLIISLDIETDKNMDKIQNAIKRGIYYGLDIKRVAEPKKVKINYCQER